MSLTRAQLVEAATANLGTRVVDVPEWGGAILIRVLPLGERFDMVAMLQGGGENKTKSLFDAIVRLVLVSIVNPDGTRMFADDDEDVLRGFDIAGFAAVREAVLELNGMKASEDESESPLAD
jgi:hypothetical protein